MLPSFWPEMVYIGAPNNNLSVSDMNRCSTKREREIRLRGLEAHGQDDQPTMACFAYVWRPESLGISARGPCPHCWGLKHHVEQPAQFAEKSTSLIEEMLMKGVWRDADVKAVEPTHDEKKSIHDRILKACVWRAASSVMTITQGPVRTNGCSRKSGWIPMFHPRFNKTKHSKSGEIPICSEGPSLGDPDRGRRIWQHPGLERPRLLHTEEPVMAHKSKNCIENSIQPGDSSRILVASSYKNVCVGISWKCAAAIFSSVFFHQNVLRFPGDSRRSSKKVLPPSQKRTFSMRWSAPACALPPWWAIKVRCNVVTALWNSNDPWLLNAFEVE